MQQKDLHTKQRTKQRIELFKKVTIYLHNNFGKVKIERKYS